MSGWQTTVFAIADHVSGTRFTARRLDGPHYLVPKAEGDALRAVAAAAVAWHRYSWPELRPDGVKAGPLWDAVVAYEAATAPAPEPKPTCADCGMGLPLDFTQAGTDDEPLCIACFDKRHAAARQHARAARVREALEEHQGQGVEYALGGPPTCWLTPGPRITAAEGYTDAYLARVTAIRWRVPCLCPDCEGHAWQVQHFEEETP